MTQFTEHSDNEHRISLIMFTDQTVTIKTWWTTEDKYALLEAALGDPEVESMYPREYVNQTADEVMHEGIHVIKDETDECDPS